MILTKQQREYLAKTVLKLKKDYSRNMFGEKSHWKMKYKDKSYHLDYNDLTWWGKPDPLIWRTDVCNHKKNMSELDSVLFEKFLDRMTTGVQMVINDQSEAKKLLIEKLGI